MSACGTASVVLLFEATQEARHSAMLRANELAKRLVADAMHRSQGSDQPRFAIYIKEDTESKSIRQLRFIHGPLLTQISEQVRVEGVRYTKTVWKEYLKDLFIPDHFDEFPTFHRDASGAMCVLPDKTIRKRPKSLSNMSIKECSDFIDKVIAHASVEWGVQWNLDEAERAHVKAESTL